MSAHNETRMRCLTGGSSAEIGNNELSLCGKVNKVWANRVGGRGGGGTLVDSRLR